MKYKLLSNTTAAALSENVSKHLEEGWGLYGNPSSAIAGIAVQYSAGYSVASYSQAVILKEKEKPVGPPNIYELQ